MTSANGTAGGDFDERLAQALSAALYDGEEVIAQETGDQGQAIVLTKSRIIIVKAGLAATGELGGHKASPFAIEAVTSINLRKGPLGAVIQVCTENAAASHQNGAPDNVVVFTGPGRVKKADAFAAAVQSATGKPINRAGRSQQHAAEPAEPPRLRPEPKSLAEELYGEMMQADRDAASSELSARAELDTGPMHASTTDTSVAPASESIAVESAVEEEAEPEPVEYHPNPRLPKPIRRQHQGPSRILVLLGIAAALVFVCMAVMAPVRDAQNLPNVPTGPTYTSVNAKSIRAQLNAASAYHKQIANMVSRAQAEGAACRSAVRSGSKAAIRAIGEASKTDRAWTGVNAIPAPPGLAEAKQNLLSGLLTQKNAITAASSAAQTSAPLAAGESLSRLDEAAAQIRKGLTAVISTRHALQKQAAQLGKPTRH